MIISGGEKYFPHEVRRKLFKGTGLVKDIVA